MTNWFTRFNDFIHQQPATNEDFMKPFDWDARTEEVKAHQLYRKLSYHSRGSFPVRYL